MFAFRLCLELGEKHPDYLLPCLTSRQLSEWQAYFQMQPFGQDVLQFMLAQFMAMYCNVHKKKGSEDQKPKDFMPSFPKPQSPDEIKFQIRSLLARVGNGNR